jgi:hypothetical protein
MELSIPCVLMIVIYSISAGEIEVPSFTFVKGQILELEAGHWIVGVDVSVPNLSDPIDDLSNRLIKIKDESFVYVNNMTDVFKSENLVLLNETFTSLEDEALNLKRRIDRLVKPVPDQRHARGYIDILGRGLHAIAGVATDEDLDKTNRQLDFVASKNRQIVHILGQQMTFYRRTSEAVANHDKALKRIDSGLLALSYIIKANEVKTNERTDNIYREIHFLNSLQSTFALARHNLISVSDEISRCERAENEAWESRLTPSLISPSEYLKLLHSVQANLPQELSLISQPSEGNLQYLYNTATVTLLRRGLTLRFLVSLPLRNTGNFYQVYNILPYASNAEGSKFYTANLDTQYIAVSLDSSKFMLLPPGYISKCHRKSSLLCPPELPILTSQYPSCAISAFQSPGNKATKYCMPIQEVNITPSFFKGENLGTWHYFVQQAMKFTFECYSPDVRDEKRWGVVNGRGKIVVPPGCVARNSQTALHSEWQNKLYDVSHIDSFRVLPFSPALFLTGSNDTLLPDPSVTILSLRTNNTTDNSVYESESSVLLKELDQSISDLNNNSSTFLWPDLHKPAVSYSLGGSSVVLLILLIIVSSFLCRKRARSSPLVSIQPSAPYPTVQYMPPEDRCPRE